MKLYDIFENASDEMVNIPWRIYNLINNNRLITKNYAKLAYPRLKSLDDAEVKTINFLEDHIAVFVNYDIDFSQGTYYFFEWGDDDEGGTSIMEYTEVLEKFHTIPQFDAVITSYEKDCDNCTKKTKYLLKGIFDTNEDAEMFRKSTNIF